MFLKSFCVSAVSGAVGFAVLQPAGRWWLLVVVGVEFITEGDFAGRVPVALAVVRIWI
jgi:hypothetical protein